MEEKIEKKVCKSVDYINRIAQNLGEISEEALEKLLQAIKGSRRVVLSAEGRSRSGLFLGIKGINKRLFAETDSSWHWRNITEAAADFETKRGKTVLLINSGSGDTNIPKEMAKDLRSYINETGSQKFIICAVTSHPESEIAKQSDIVVELKGREKEKEETNPLVSGTMRDVYELASMVLFQKIKEATNRNLSAKEILIMIKKEMEIIGDLIDDYLASKHYQELVEETASRERAVSSKHYQELVEETASRERAVFGGRGPDREVAEMTAIRTLHIKSVVGGIVFLAGSLALPPKPGDIIVLISFSGETKSTLKWCDDYKAAGGIAFSIVGNKSTLSEESRSYILKAPLEEFYVRAAFLLSPLPGGVMEKFRKCGIRIPEEIIRILGHSKTE